MRKTFILLAAMLTAALQVPACTNFIVAKGASTDGSVICSYNADSYGMFQNLCHYPAATHPKGTKLKIYDWDTGEYHGEIDEAAQTYNVIGNINEWQLTIGETTYGGREEMVDSTGILDYGSLIYNTLRRAKTAREAISVMTSLVEKYGYNSSGETFTICDPNEAWIVEMMGCGPDRKLSKERTVWVAMRIPDNAICGHANQSRIGRFDMKDKKNVLYSKNVVSYARKKGWFSGKDSEFSWKNTYATMHVYGASTTGSIRIWSATCRGLWASIPMQKICRFGLCPTASCQCRMWKQLCATTSRALRSRSTRMWLRATGICLTAPHRSISRSTERNTSTSAPQAPSRQASAMYRRCAHGCRAKSVV